MSDSTSSLQDRYARLKQLYRVSKVIHSTLEPFQALKLILKEAVRITRASSGSIAILNPTTGFLEIQCSHRLPVRAAALMLRVGEGITGWVAKNSRPARVGDVRTDPRYIMLRRNVRSELAVPLEVGGLSRGVINVDSDRLDAFSVEDEELLQEFAVQAAKVIHNTWIYEQFRQKARLFESLAGISQAINSTLNLDEALRVIARQAAELMSAKLCSVQMLAEDGQWLELRASHGAGPAYLGKPRLSVEESLLGTVIRRRKPLQVFNVQESARYQSVDIARTEGLVSLLSVPLVFDDRAIGTINVYTSEPHSFSNEEIGILTALSTLSATAIEKARLYERIVNAEEQLRQSEKLSALGLLAAEVAHEIRNPLTVMKMLYHSMNLQFAPGDPRARDAEMMGEKMEHLNRIVEHILDFARSTEPALAWIDVNRILEELCLLTRHKLAQQNTRLIRRWARDLPRIHADATQIEQAFLNLILNATEAMPAGGRLTLITSWTQPNPETKSASVHIEFRDTGQGMTREQQQRAFTSLLNTTKPRGTGLGLAIVNRIVEVHRGRILVRSRPGKGTSIRLILPVAGPEAAHPPAPFASGLPATPAL